MTDHAHPAACENCHTPLAGEYCHHCGQPAHNPLKSFAHAVEDVFESFWHLDGRIFRTLRELWIPGRIACNYLAGQRVRYLPPLRLFVIMSLFAFFVARLAVSTDAGLLEVDAGDERFAALATVAEVERQRDELLAGLADADGGNAVAATALAASREAIRAAARQRIDELEGRRTPREPKLDLNLELDSSGRPWHPVDNPVHYDFLPHWANASLNHRLERLQANLQPGPERGTQLLRQFLAALPPALFVMMPLLALVLRLLYWRRPMGYLEHLVVALYSHAWLLTALLLGSAASALADLAGVAVLSSLASLLATLLWVGVPVYLWIMQRRVYGGRLWAHGLRYVGTGAVYGLLVLMAALYAMIASLTA